MNELEGDSVCGIQAVFFEKHFLSFSLSSFFCSPKNPIYTLVCSLVFFTQLLHHSTTTTATTTSTATSSSSTSQQEAYQTWILLSCCSCHLLPFASSCSFICFSSSFPQTEEICLSLQAPWVGLILVKPFSSILRTQMCSLLPK